jgi:hypothetical protein
LLEAFDVVVCEDYPRVFGKVVKDEVSGVVETKFGDDCLIPQRFVEFIFFLVGYKNMDDRLIDLVVL